MTKFESQDLPISQNNFQPTSDEEDAQILSKNSRWAQVEDYFAQEVKLSHVDLLMLVCCLITGFLDSTLYNAFSTFVSMQTGNTIFVALGASGQNTRPYGWARSLTSIGFFMMGSFSFARFNRRLGARRRGTLICSFLLQSIFILVAAGLIQGKVIRGDVPNKLADIQWNQLAPIALLSFQSAGQIACSRALEVGEIPTIVITSLLFDLFSDAQLFSSLTDNIKRNRRAAGFALTLVGAICGGWVSKATKGVQTMLFIAGGLKLLLTFLWAFWSRV